jgi:hypothetical protein
MLRRKLYTGYNICNKSHILAQWTMAESEQFHCRAMSGQPMVGCEWPCTIPITRDIQIMLNYFMPVYIYMHILSSNGSRLCHALGLTGLL